MAAWDQYGTEALRTETHQLEMRLMERLENGFTVDDMGGAPSLQLKKNLLKDKRSLTRSDVEDASSLMVAMLVDYLGRRAGGAQHAEMVDETRQLLWRRYEYAHGSMDDFYVYFDWLFFRYGLYVSYARPHAAAPAAAPVQFRVW